MLFLLFQLGENRYAFEAAQIEEILPLVEITPIAQAPTGVAGVFNYCGAPVPVIDLSQLTLGRPARRRLSTRMIVAHYADDTGANRFLALIAEKAMETVRREPSDFSPSGISSDGAGFLGPVATDAHGLLQRIEVSKLLPASVREVLFKEAITN